MLKGTTVTSATYCDLPRNHLWSAVRSECHGMLSNDVLLQYGNDRTPTAHVTAKMMKGTHCEGVLQFPYLPDIAAYDSLVFGLIKKAVGKIHFDLMKCKRQWKSDLTSANPLAPNSAYSVSHHTGFSSWMMLCMCQWIMAIRVQPYWCFLCSCFLWGVGGINFAWKS